MRFYKFTFGNVNFFSFLSDPGKGHSKILIPPLVQWVRGSEKRTKHRATILYNNSFVERKITFSLFEMHKSKNVPPGGSWEGRFGDF